MKFTQHQLDTAVKVLMETDLVKNWAKGVLKSYGVPMNTPEGQKFMQEQREKIARKIVSSAQ